MLKRLILTALLCATAWSAAAAPYFIGTDTAVYSYNATTAAVGSSVTPSGQSMASYPNYRATRLTADGSRLFVADPTGIYWYNATTMALIGSYAATLPAPIAWDIAPSGGVLWLAINNTTGGSGTAAVDAIIAIDTTTGSRLATLNGLKVRGLAVGPGGAQVFALAQSVDPVDIANGTTAWSIVTLSTSTYSVIATSPLALSSGLRISGSFSAYGMAVNGAGTQLAIANGNSSNSLILWNIATATATQVAKAGLTDATYALDDATVYAVRSEGVDFVTAATGAVATSVSTGLVNTTGLALATDGSALYAIGAARFGVGAYVYAINPTTGATGAPTQILIDNARTLSTTAPARPTGTPQTGYWWTVGAGGRGIGIEVQGSTLMLGIYSYDANGYDSWTIGTCTLSASSCSGNLQAYANGTTLSNLGVASTTPTTLGSPGAFALTFSSATTATLTIGATSVAITRYPLDGSAVVTPPSWVPQSGWWYSTGYPGVGWFLESQGNLTVSGTSYSRVFLVGYMYGSSGGSGQANWYAGGGLYSQLASLGGNLPFWSGNLYEYFGGPPIGGTARGLSVYADRGTLTVSFTSSTQGTLILPNGQRLAITRYSF